MLTILAIGSLIGGFAVMVGIGVYIWWNLRGN